MNLKKILILFTIFISCFWLSVKPTVATIGEPCCRGGDPRVVYNPLTNLCEGVLAQINLQISCNTSVERCLPGSPEMRGTCISKDTTVPTPPGITCGNQNQPCCPGASAGSRRTCRTDINVVPDDPFSGGCLCLVPTPPFAPTPGEIPPVNSICPLSGGKFGVNTAIGCIPANDLNELIKWFLSKLIFVASGIAFLLMAFGAIQIITSAGNPDKMKAGSQLITSALSGLIFIILSAFLLKLIGVDILQIPGL